MHDHRLNADAERLTSCGREAEPVLVGIALQNAASVATLLLTTDALVSEIKEDKKTPPMPGGGMGM